MLDRNSTLQDALREYREYSDYESQGSVERAKYFVVACRHLLSYPMRAIRRGEVGSEVEFNHESVRSEMKHAQQWIAETDSENASSYHTGVHFDDFEEWR